MANNCYFEMKIKGTAEDCGKWYKRMISYDEPNYFHRIFSADIYEEGDIDKEHYMCIAGECAWSLDTCRRTSGDSEGKDLFAMNSQELSIDMEVYSSEPGMAFQEHYIYKHGECLNEECIDYEEIFYDKEMYENFEKFKNKYNLPKNVTEDDLDEGWYNKGGFASWEFTI